MLLGCPSISLMIVGADINELVTIERLSSCNKKIFFVMSMVCCKVEVSLPTTMFDEKTPYLMLKHKYCETYWLHLLLRLQSQMLI